MTSRSSDAATATATRGGRWWTFFAVAVIAISTAAAYSNSFRVPFLLDDIDSIQENHTTLSDWRSVLSPPPNAGVAGRPFLNLTFAVDRAVFGGALAGYHLTNLVIHVCAAVVAFLLLKLTLRAAQKRDADTPADLLVPLTAALLWAIHPLNTAAVTYLSQRAESLMALLYLVALYTFARSCHSPAPNRWRVASVLACLLGTLTKEPIVTAPLLILLYDRAFCSGTFRHAWKQYRAYYVALGCTALFVVASFWIRPVQMVGFNTDVSPLRYAFTEGEAVTRYLRLSLCPYPLVFDYGVHDSPFNVVSVAYVLLVLAVLAAAAWQLARNTAVGFLGAGIFVLLAPSSSFIPVALQPIAESRAYLPSLAVVVLAVLFSKKLIGARYTALLGAGLSLAFLLGTYTRNLDFRSEVSIWEDTVQKRPRSARAHNSLGFALVRRGQLAQGMDEYRRALALKPEYMLAHYNLGSALLRLNEVDGALAEFETARALQQTYPPLYNNLATALQRKGRNAEALEVLIAGVKLDPQSPELQFNLGTALFRQHRFQEAIVAYTHALQLTPGLTEAYYLRALSLRGVHRDDEAQEDLRRALALRPNWPPALNQLKSLAPGQAPPQAPKP